MVTQVPGFAVRADGWILVPTVNGSLLFVAPQHSVPSNTVPKNLPLILASVLGGVIVVAVVAAVWWIRRVRRNRRALLNSAGEYAFMGDQQLLDSQYTRSADGSMVQRVLRSESDAEVGMAVYAGSSTHAVALDDETPVAVYMTDPDMGADDGGARQAATQLDDHGVAVSSTLQHVRGGKRPSTRRTRM
ncbi:hypothetical protein EON62_05070 [archaeon]|nr:MAG: hypothetical protein EON62_05070 [archaeon]